MGSFLRRLAFSLWFREPDPLISRNVTDESRVIYNRDIEGRVRELAPFLRFDGNPYPVVADGRISWVIDAYTTTADYPYSQSVDTDVNGSLAGGYNYVRNSVKAVIDAYDGDVTFYVVDDTDPLIAAWASVFPDMFTGADEVPPELEAHFRYPEDIFTVQTDMWSSYVVGNATQFIEGALAWSVAAQPRIEAQVGEGEGVVAGGSMEPQYLMARVPLPDSTGDEFVIQRAFVPRGGSAGTETARPELTGIMMARSDPEHYGELVMVRLPGGRVAAPDLVHSEIRKTDDLTEFIKEKAGAKVEFGEMSIVLLDDTIVYVRPVYVEANSATAVPELQRVVAVNGDRIVMGHSIQEAISGVVGSGSEPAQPTATPDQAPETEDPAVDDVPYEAEGKSVVQLIADAEEFLTGAQVAENNGLDEQAASMRAKAQVALAAAQELLGGPADTPSTTLPPADDTTGTTTAEEQAAADG
jgi:uncharacterized membrane protein (UPF0182 family)